MKAVFSRRLSFLVFSLLALLLAFGIAGFAQSKPQKSETPKGNQKRNQRPVPKT